VAVLVPSTVDIGILLAHFWEFLAGAVSGLSVPKIRNVGSRVSCRHPLVMAMQTTDILKFEHRSLLGWLHRP
jgi:hypothetical protein